MAVKGKGSQLEREISKFLTKWLIGSEKPYHFWRSEASGGLATIHEENVHMTGDICSIHPESRFFTDTFSIECKTGYPKTSFWQHFSSKKFGIEKFWDQTLSDAQKADKYPMLIYRKKGRRQIVGIDDRVHQRLFKRTSDLNHIRVCWSKESPKNELLLFDMEDFFERVKPDDIRKLKKAWQH